MQATNPIDPGAEWLEADGLGGFASGTVSGIRTRRYHALRLTATTPPVGRMVLANGLDAWVETARGRARFAFL
jgi:Glycogen debranching enzyme N terminal